MGNSVVVWWVEQIQKSIMCEGGSVHFVRMTKRSTIFRLGMYVERTNSTPTRGIEPRSPAWQAGILATILCRMFPTYSTYVHAHKYTATKILPSHIHYVPLYTATQLYKRTLAQSKWKKWYTRGSGSWWGSIRTENNSFIY